MPRFARSGLVSPSEGTCIFRGDADNVPWCIEVKLDAAGLPHALYAAHQRGQKVLLSLCGTYRSYTDYELCVLGWFFRGALSDLLSAGKLPVPPPSVVS